MTHPTQYVLISSSTDFVTSDFFRKNFRIRKYVIIEVIENVKTSREKLKSSKTMCIKTTGINPIDAAKAIPEPVFNSITSRRRIKVSVM